MIDGKICIHIATPCYGGFMTMEYVNSLLKSVSYLESKDIMVEWTFLNKEAMITRARNELVRKFMDDTRDDYLMFIDADIEFPADGIYNLLQHKKEIIVGIYPKKFLFWDRILEAAQTIPPVDDISKYGCSYVLNCVDDQGDPEKVPLNKEGLVEVLHGGTGFMLIDRKVFKKLKFKVPSYRTSLIQDKNGQYTAPLTREYFAHKITELGLYLSEDYYFSELAIEHNIKIFADPTINLNHIGSYNYSGDLMKAGRNNT